MRNLVIAWWSGTVFIADFNLSGRLCAGTHFSTLHTREERFRQSPLLSSEQPQAWGSLESQCQPSQCFLPTPRSPPATQRSWEPHWYSIWQWALQLPREGWCSVARGEGVLVLETLISCDLGFTREWSPAWGLETSLCLREWPVVRASFPAPPPAHAHVCTHSKHSQLTHTCDPRGAGNSAWKEIYSRTLSTVYWVLADPVMSLACEWTQTEAVAGTPSLLPPGLLWMFFFISDVYSYLQSYFPLVLRV